MNKKVVLLNTENEATERLPKRNRTGGLYQKYFKGQGKMMWLGQLYSKGKKYRTKPYHTKTEAKDALNRFRVEVKQQRRQISEKVTLAKFSDEFLEDARLNSRNYVSHIYRLKHLKPFFRNAKLEDITRADVHRYINQRLREEANRATINRELACLKRMLNVAVEWEKLVVNPMYRMKLLKEEERPVRSLSSEEEDRLLTYCRHSTHPVYKIMEPIILVAEHTGMRQSELLNLKWEQVDFLNSVITLSKTKAKKIRLLPMNSVVVDTLLKLKSGAEFVFPINRKGDYRSRLKYHWGELCKKVGLVNFRFHDLRATFATRLDSQGVGAFTIKSLLGHSTMEVTKRYIGVDESSRRAVEKLSIRHEIRHLEEESVDQPPQLM